MDISFLYNKSKPIFAKLIITPLAPLSMVSSIPGGHYKTQNAPTHFMLCGLLENVLGWHFSIKDRELIRKGIKKHFSGNKKQKETFEFYETNSSYLPLIAHLFNIELTMTPPLTFHNDLWKKAYRRADATVHPKGTPNLDYKMIALKNALPKDEKGKTIDKAYEELFKKNLGKFPLYYSTLATREYITAKGDFIIKISIDCKLYEIISEALTDNDLGYLGTNDGWVSLTLEKL